MSSRSSRLAFAFVAIIAVMTSPSAEAVLVEYTSDFDDANLSAPLPPGPFTFGVTPTVDSFDVVSSTGNTIPAGDSVSFSSTLETFLRGTSAPATVPGFATTLGVPDVGVPTITIAFDTAFPVTQIRVTLADLEVSGSSGPTTLDFSAAASGGLPTSVTDDLVLASGDVTTTNLGNGIHGEVVWDFATPVVDPTVEFVYNPAFTFDEMHFAGLAYTVLIPEPTAALFGTLITGGLGFCVARRPSRQED